MPPAHRTSLLTRSQGPIGPSRSILLCVDGSAESAAAVFAIAVFLSANDDLTIFTSYPPPSFSVLSSFSLASHASRGSRLRTSQRTAERHVDFARRDVAENGGIAAAWIDTHVEIAAGVGAALTNFSLARRYGMVVVGHHVSAGVRRLLTGSTAAHVVTHAAAGTAVVVVSCGLGEGFGSQPVRLCLCYDGQDNSDAVVRELGESWCVFL